jgi:protein-tyrosine-phosphatase/predicted ATP-grasp superfamily ATP-dependent carboligase
VDAPARRSRYVAAVHELPTYSPSSISWKDTFLGLLREQHYDLVIPCNDPSILPLQAHRAEFEREARLAIPGDKAFEVAFDKIRSCELAQTLGVPLPKWTVVRTLNDLPAVLSSLGLPLVLKPRSSFQLEDLRNRRVVRRVSSVEELERLAREELERGELLIQENFPGSGLGVEVLADRGEALLLFQHERVHEPPWGGGSSYRKSAPLDPSLLDATRRLLATLDYTGVAMVEFRRNAQGSWIFVEINGRFWGSLPLALSCGVDFPWALYRLLVDCERPTNRSYPIAIHARNLTLDLGWLAQTLRAAHTDRHLAAAFFRDLLSEAWNILRLRERVDTFVLDDPEPGWAELRSLIARHGPRVLRYVRRLPSTLPPLRRWRSERALRAVRKAQTVLFVCKGNICRSPFAAAYARLVLPDSVTIQSAGYYPISNRPSPLAAIEGAEGLGVELASHRSAVISEEIVQRADVIFVFDDENLEAVRATFPTARPRVHRLGVLLSSGPLSIGDPLGGSVTTFLECYRRIAQCLDTVRSQTGRPAAVRSVTPGRVGPPDRSQLEHGR